MKLQLKRSNVLVSGAAKEPTASQLDYGELAINYSTADAAIFLKDSSNNVIRIAGVHNIADDGLTNVPTTTSPPTSPTPETGNLWYNSEDGRLYIYYVDDNSSQWVDASPDTWQTTVIPDTTNPAHQAGTLDDRYVNINGDTLTGALLLDNAATVATPDLAFDGDLNTGIYSPGADSLAITTGGTQRVTVDSSGRVGIGSTDPSPFGNNAKLVLQRSGSGESASCVIHGASDASSLIQFSDGSGSAAERNAGFITVNHTDQSMQFGIQDNEKMRIDSSGDLSLTGSTDQRIRLNTAGGGGNDSVNLRGDGNNLKLNAATGTGNHIFEIGGTERMRIDSSGNVGIGTSSIGNISGFTQLVLNNSTGGLIQFEDDGSNIGRIVSNSSALTLRTAGSLIFETNGSTEGMRLDASSQLKIGTTLSGYKLAIGAGTNSGPQGIIVDTTTRTPTDYTKVFTGVNESGTESIQLYSNGSARFAGSVSIGGTAPANTIDEYEEGTFTPTLSGAAAGGTFTGNNSTGKYTRIGRLVTLNVRIENATLSGASGAIRVLGLPFTAGPAPYAVSGTMMLYNVSFQTDRVQSFYINPNTTTIYGLQSRNGTTWISWDAAYFNASSVYVVFTITYKVP
jgi:hypothetical protein